MTCVHLQQLYQLCTDQQLRLSSSDLVHIVCEQCNQHEVCPSVLTEEYEDDDEQDSQSPAGANSPSE